MGPPLDTFVICEACRAAFDHTCKPWFGKAPALCAPTAGAPRKPT
jgi:hypothetical protein